MDGKRARANSRLESSSLEYPEASDRTRVLASITWISIATTNRPSRLTMKLFCQRCTSQISTYLYLVLSLIAFTLPISRAFERRLSLYRITIKIFTNLSESVKDLLSCDVAFNSSSLASLLLFSFLLPLLSLYG